jgi:hypothetical protein
VSSSGDLKAFACETNQNIGRTIDMETTMENTQMAAGMNMMMPGMNMMPSNMMMPQGMQMPTMGMVARCEMKMEMIEGGCKIDCCCQDEMSKSMMQKMCKMMEGGMCSMMCSKNGVCVCQCNMFMGDCSMEMTEMGMCVCWTSSDAKCCEMIQSCCKSMMDCMAGGCSCCMMINGMPVCCCC